VEEDKGPEVHMDMQHRDPSTHYMAAVGKILVDMNNAHQLDRTQHEKLHLESHKLEAEELD